MGQRIGPIINETVLFPDMGARRVSRRRTYMVRRSIWVGFVVLCLVCGFKTSTALAQAVFGSVIGTVTDAQGNAVSGAKVTVTSVAKSTAYETTSNESGNYAVTHLIPDNYRVHVEAAGFKAYD